MPRTDQMVSQTVSQMLHETSSTIASLATSTGIPIPRLKSLMYGLDGFDIRELHRICRHLGLKTSEFFARAGM